MRVIVQSSGLGLRVEERPAKYLVSTCTLVLDVPTRSSTGGSDLRLEPLVHEKWRHSFRCQLRQRFCGCEVNKCEALLAGNLTLA